MAVIRCGPERFIDRPEYGQRQRAGALQHPPVTGRGADEEELGLVQRPPVGQSVDRRTRERYAGLEVDDHKSMCFQRQHAQLIGQGIVLFAVRPKDDGMAPPLNAVLWLRQTKPVGTHVADRGVSPVSGAVTRAPSRYGVPMAQHNNIWVVHDIDTESWHVRREGEDQPLQTFSTQNEAFGAGRERAKQDEVELMVQGTDGRIVEKNSYGKDPRDVPG